MNRHDIMALARQAASEDGSVEREDGKNIVLYAAKTNQFLERFARLVAAAERSDCIAIIKNEQSFWSDPDVIEVCNFAIDSIQARGQT